MRHESKVLPRVTFMILFGTVYYWVKCSTTNKCTQNYMGTDVL